MRTVSERLAEHVVRTRFEDLPPAVVEKAKDLAVYHVGLAFAGRAEARGRAAVALARELSGAERGSTIIAHSDGASLLDAIYAHAELVSADDRDDVHIRSKMRLGRMTQPVAWILGQSRRVTGREFIAALVVAYDASCALAEPQPMAGDYRRMPHKNAFAPFAAAAVAARLLGQSAERAAHTIALAAHVAMGVNEGLRDTLAFSLMARDAVLAAMAPGFVLSRTLKTIESPVGLYAAFFDGVPEGLDQRLERLGRDFAILGTDLRRASMSASHRAPLSTLHALVTRTGLRAEDASSIVAVLPDELRGRFETLEPSIEKPELTDYDLGRSLRLKLALVLTTGEIVPGPTLAQHWSSQIRDILSRVRLEFEDRPMEYARLEVRTTSGETLAEEGWLVPEQLGDRTGWLRMNAEHLLSSARLERLGSLLEHLEDVVDVGEVLATTVPDRENA